MERLVGNGTERLSRASGERSVAADIRRLFRATQVNRNLTTDPYQPQPSILVNAWLVVQRKEGALLTIRSREAPETLPANAKFFETHLKEMRSGRMRCS